MGSERSDMEILLSSSSAGYVGGGYYNPVEEFQRVARPLQAPEISEVQAHAMCLSSDAPPTYVIQSIYQTLRALLRADEVLFGMYDNGRYFLAVQLPTEERLMDFEAQVRSGDLRNCGFFALSASQANQGLTRDFEPTDSGRSNQVT